MIHWICSLLVLGAGVASPALQEAELASLLERERVEHRMPGLRAAVRFPDGQVVRAAVGQADREAGTPLDDAIGMPGGSTGKTFVAALALRLVELGKLKLDDPVSKYVGDEPWFGRLPNAETIEVQHLLSHSSGLRDYPGTFGFKRGMIWRVIRHGSAYFTPEELIGFVARGRPPFAPGEGYRYTDAGYLVLGRVIEAAGGESYYELLQEEILDPFGLTETRPQVDSALPDIATGYMAGSRNLKKDGRMKFDPRSEWTGGGLVTTPTDLVRFHGELADRWPALLEEMRAGGWRDSDKDWHYGYGLFVDHEDGSHGHGGLWPGYRTHVTHFPADDLTIAVQANRDGRVDLPGLVDQIRQQALEADSASALSGIDC